MWVPSAPARPRSCAGSSSPRRDSRSPRSPGSGDPSDSTWEDGRRKRSRSRFSPKSPRCGTGGLPRARGSAPAGRAKVENVRDRGGGFTRPGASADEEHPIPDQHGINTVTRCRHRWTASPPVGDRVVDVYAVVDPVTIGTRSIQRFTSKDPELPSVEYRLAHSTPGLRQRHRGGVAFSADLPGVGGGIVDLDIIEAVGDLVVISAARSASAEYEESPAVGGGGGVVAGTRHRRDCRKGFGRRVKPERVAEGPLCSGAPGQVDVRSDQCGGDGPPFIVERGTESPAIGRGIEDLDRTRSPPESPEQIEPALPDFRRVMMSTSGPGVVLIGEIPASDRKSVV